MRNGFKFSPQKCVNCNACSAACILENGWKVNPRTVFTYNSDAEPSFPIIHLSMACNHCESAICMDGCPASAYHREKVTGAIVLDESKCIGCRYCQWNCPYDAPKFDSESKIIGKCNLCFSRLIDGGQPACSMGCPTGALNFGKLTEQDSGNNYSWIPDKKLKPAIEFSDKKSILPLRIIPEVISGNTYSKPFNDEKGILSEWSLLLFSFLATLLVSAIFSSFILGVYPEKLLFIPGLLLTGFISFFHLGRKLRSWRSITNVSRSPLSREIAAFIIFAAVSAVTVFLRAPALLIASSIIGLVFLILIDSVYVYSDRSPSVVLHSGQTFISALLIGSFFSVIILPFVFIAAIKIYFSVRSLCFKKLKSANFGLRFLRLAFLIISGISLISHSSYPEISLIVLFLTGEFFDRILFYTDFSPISISTLIGERLNIERYEKKRN
jgi:Fe-S-cluster-containing dehydrogenase component